MRASRPLAPVALGLLLACFTAPALRGAEDPWIEAEALLARGAREEALALAKQSDDERLAAYLRAQEGGGNAAARDAYAEAEAANTRGPAAALAILDEAIAKGALGNDVSSVRIESSRGSCLRALRKLDESSGSYVSSAKRAAGIGWRVAAALGYREAGLSQAYQRDFDAAMPHWDAALEIYEAAGDRDGIADIKRFRANVYSARGDFEKALPLAQEVLAYYEEKDFQGGIAAMANNIGGILGRQSRFIEARPYFERSLAIATKAGDKPAMTNALYNIGILLKATGALGESIGYLERALGLWEALGRPPSLKDPTDAVGDHYYNTKDFAAARRYYERALAYARSTQNKSRQADVLVSLGMTVLEEDAQESLPMFEEALALAEQSKDALARADALTWIANAHETMGAQSKAFAYMQRAHAGYAELGRRSSACTALGQLAGLHLDLGRPEEALARRKEQLGEAEALGMLDERLAAQIGIGAAQSALGRHADAMAAARAALPLLRASLRSLGETAAAGYRSKLWRVFAMAIRAARAIDDAEATLFFMEASRANALMASMRNARHGGATPLPDELANAEEAARRREAQVRARLRKLAPGAGLAAHRKLRAEIEEAERAYAQAIERIRRARSAAADALEPRIASLASIQKVLEPADALVVISVLDADASACVVTQKALRIVDLGARDDLWRAYDGFDPEKPQTLLALRGALVVPLALEPSVRRVFLSPEVYLGHLPFCLLLPKRDVVYVPSGSTLVMLAREAQPAGKGVLALGDPDYSAIPSETASTHRGGRRLLPLPATRGEVEAVGTQRLLGADASETALRAALSKPGRYRAVHLACHGLARPDWGFLSSLALTPAPPHDGFLTAAEILRLRVRADLVTLSACETAVGGYRWGEGFVGFPRAFFIAGAPRVLVSLWKVDDEATRALMERFYALWSPPDGSKGVSAAAALRKAQEHVRRFEKWEDPKYHGAWQLWGLP